MSRNRWMDFWIDACVWLLVANGVLAVLNASVDAAIWMAGK